MATADKLQYLNETKQQIKAAIIAKGVSVSNTDTFRSYANKIAAIETGGATIDSQEDALLTGEITTYTNDRITKVRNQGLANFENLESVTLSNVIEIGEEGLAYNPNLYDVQIRNAKTLGMSCFRDCYSLSEIYLDSVDAIPAQCFYDCESLMTIHLPSSTKLVTLASVDALAGTAIANGEGSIYVSMNMIDQYKTAANWSEYADRFVAAYGPF